MPIIYNVGLITLLSTVRIIIIDLIIIISNHTLEIGSAVIQRLIFREFLLNQQAPSWEAFD